MKAFWFLIAINFSLWRSLISVAYLGHDLVFHLQRGEGVFLNVHRTTCTGAGGELPTAAAQARGGLFGPRCFHVFPSS